MYNIVSILTVEGMCFAYLSSGLCVCLCLCVCVGVGVCVCGCGCVCVWVGVCAGLEMRSRQAELERVKGQLEKRNQEIEELQARLQDAEKLLVNTHKRTHAHTHTLSLSHTHSLSLTHGTLSHTHTH